MCRQANELTRWRCGSICRNNWFKISFSASLIKSGTLECAPIQLQCRTVVARGTQDMTMMCDGNFPAAALVHANTQNRYAHICQHSYLHPLLVPTSTISNIWGWCNGSGVGKWEEWRTNVHLCSTSSGKLSGSENGLSSSRKCVWQPDQLRDW